MFIKVRLYKKYDFDLCKLYIANPRYFTLQLGEALRCYVRKIDFTAQFSAFTLNAPPDVIEIKLFLDDIADADVISFLQKILPKRRNAFIKGMFHHYLNTNTLQMFLVENTDPSMQTEEPKRVAVQNTLHQQSDKIEKVKKNKEKNNASEVSDISQTEEEKVTETPKQEVYAKQQVTETFHDKKEEKKTEINEADIDDQAAIDDFLSSILNCF